MGMVTVVVDFNTFTCESLLRCWLLRFLCVDGFFRFVTRLLARRVGVAVIEALDELICHFAYAFQALARERSPASRMPCED